MILPEGYYDAKQPRNDTRDDEEWSEAPTSLNEDDEPPPSYDAHTQDSRSSASSSSSSHPPPRRSATAPASGARPEFVNATNFHFVTMTHGSIKEKLVIDPMRHVPAILLPALRHGESAATRPNLRLETMNGAISADVKLVQSSRKNSRREKTILYAKTSHGAIDFRLDDTPSDTPRLPIELALDTCNGHINVWLPRSFRGFITSSTLAGGTSFSEGISNSGHLIENGATARIFVGDYSEDADDLEYDEEDENAAAPEWKGDKVVLHTMHGEVQVRYVDESTRTPLGFRARGLAGGGVLGGGPPWLPPVLHPLFPLNAGAHMFNAMPGMPGGPRVFNQRPNRSQTSGFFGRWS